MNIQQHCCGLQKLFNDKQARKDLKRLRKKGPNKPTRILLQYLDQLNIPQMTLLDIGGGVGAIQMVLAQKGIQAITGVDASPAYLQAAQQIAREMGYLEKARFIYGNFIEKASEVESADIVTLDRVLCCFPDVHALVTHSVQKARQVYGVIFPRDNFLTKLGATVLNLVLMLLRNPFRTYVHSTAVVDLLVQRQGFETWQVATAGVWQVRVYRRTNV